MENNFLKITNTVYGLLDFFPESDPLKNRAKETALSIVESLSKIKGDEGWVSLKSFFPDPQLVSKILEDIRVLQNYLELAKLQGWLDDMNFLIISKEYEKISAELSGYKKFSEIKEIKEEKKNPKKSGARANAPNEDKGITPRQKKIIEIIKERQKAQVADLKVILSNVTKRTLRRDLDDLLKKNEIVREGEWNQVFYRISNQSI